MGQILSQSEIEAILSGLNLEADHSDHLAPSTSDQVVLYDFEHPEPLRRQQLDSLKLAAAAGSQALQTSLSRVLQSSFEVTFLGVEQSTYRDYLATAEQPGCIAVFETESSDLCWLLDLGRPFSFAIIDCLLGGQPFQTDLSRLKLRPYTDVEIRLIDRAVRAIFPDLAGTLTRQGSLRLKTLVSEGSSIAEASLNDAVALVSFEVASGTHRSLIQLCLPWKEVASPAGHQEVDCKPSRFDMQSRAIKIPVCATAKIALFKMSASDLAGLNPGDVLLTDVAATQEISFEVEGRTIFRGNPGQSENRKVIRLTEAIELANNNSENAAGT